MMAATWWSSLIAAIFRNFSLFALFTYLSSLLPFILSSLSIAGCVLCTFSFPYVHLISIKLFLYFSGPSTTTLFLCQAYERSVCITHGNDAFSTVDCGLCNRRTYDTVIGLGMPHYTLFDEIKEWLNGTSSKFPLTKRPTHSSRIFTAHTREMLTVKNLWVANVEECADKTCLSRAKVIVW